ncbi:MAG: DUF86 domain-containing protein [Acidobacteriota bacterium]|jgi:uncharacterized protein YutE (UPF0331/DUF86 family)
MTDPELLAKKLAEIETHVRELRTEANLSRLREDLKEERFVAHTLQLAVQAALDAASHIVADERLGEPETNQELFALLERHGWVDPSLGASLRDMARFRNLLVHGYASIDLDIVRDIVEHHLGDLEAFVETVRGRPDRDQDRDQGRDQDPDQPG